MSKRKFQPKSSKPSPVVQSAQAGDSVLRRVADVAAGLRPQVQGQFLDLTYSDPDDFGRAMNLVADTKRRFQALPAKLRAACLNDPRELLVMVSQASRGDEVAAAVLKRHGLTFKAPEASKAPPAKEGDGSGEIPL